MQHRSQCSKNACKWIELVPNGYLRTKLTSVATVLWVPMQKGIWEESGKNLEFYYGLENP